MSDKYSWIKVYTEVLDDPKMARLNNFLWRRAIELFLLAGKNGNGGALQSVEEMAWYFRSSNDEVVKSLICLAEIGVVRETAPGEWMVVHFDKRQAAINPVERQKKHRAGVSRKCHEIVTEEEVEEESTTTTTTTAKSTNPIFAFYNANFGALTSFTAETLADLEQTYTPEWVLAALSEAVASEARNLKYAEAILRRWRTDGFKAPKDKKSGRNQSHPVVRQTVTQARDELAEWVKEKEALSGVVV